MISVYIIAELVLHCNFVWNGVEVMASRGPAKSKGSNDRGCSFHTQKMICRTANTNKDRNADSEKSSREKRISECFSRGKGRMGKKNRKSGPEKRRVGRRTEDGSSSSDALPKLDCKPL